MLELFKYQDKEVRVVEKNGFTYTTTYVTDKGLIWLEKTYGEVK